jgi:hypothetical protein
VFSASTQDGGSTESVLDRLGASWSADPDLGR